MWHHQFYRSALHQIVGTVAVIALTVACTTPPAPVALAPPAIQRILIPTPEAVSAKQFVEAAAPVANTVAPTVAEEPATGETAESAASEAADVAESASPLTPAQTELLATLPSRGVAPELHNEVWLNTDPLTLANLRGKVVMVEFWTYG